jgi:3-oxoacyl-[acyl-carrier protein] reductase
MLLQHKNAVIYGAGGAIGSAVARAFAREGARVFLAGRTLAGVAGVAAKIGAFGGIAEGAQVDATNERAIEDHLDAIVKKSGRIDISFNAVGTEEAQGVPLVDLSLEDFLLPITTLSTTVFLTSRAAGRRMSKQRGGVILTINAPSGHEALASGFGPACAAVLTISRTLAAELGPCGVRVLCLQPNALPESASLRRAVSQQAGGSNRSPEDQLAAMAGETLMGRLPTLEEVANVAAFVASDRASAMTGTTVKVNCGAQVDS